MQFIIIWLSVFIGAAYLQAMPVELVQKESIHDRNGRAIAADKPYKRIISLYGAHTENIFVLGAGDRIIGVSHSDRMLGKMHQIAIFSYHDDPEKFLAAKPDLVLIRPMIDRSYPGLIRQLERSGITVFSLQPATVSDMYHYWKILGILTDTQVKSFELIHGFKSSVAEFASLTSQMQKKKKVYFEAIHSKMKTFTKSAMAIFVLETAGGVNIAADAAQVRKTNIAYYGKERILAKAADIDVYLAQKGPMNQPTIDLIKSEPGYHVIKAVKEDQVFIVDEMKVSRPTPKLLCGIVEIGQLLYPAKYRGAVKDVSKWLKKYGVSCD